MTLRVTAQKQGVSAPQSKSGQRHFQEELSLQDAFLVSPPGLGPVCLSMKNKIMFLESFFICIFHHYLALLFIFLLINCRLTDDSLFFPAK